MASRPNGTLYVGVTADLVRRIYAHREGLVDGFTTKYGVKRLVYYEWHDRIVDAIGREKSLKRWARAWKLALIAEKNPDWADLYDQIV